ncbi:BNR repeat-containing protein [Mucilaginibacter sp. AW1-3]
MKKNFLLVLTIVFFSGLSGNIHAQNIKSTASVVDTAALTLTKGIYGNIINGQNFQQDALTSYKGWQYVAYYDIDRHVCLGRRELPAGTWQIIRFTDYYFSYAKGLMNDSHNTISIGLCKNDGTIHIAFDHHASSLHYRVSQKGCIDQPEKIKWQPSLFSEVRNYLEDGKPLNNVTYPRFVNTPQGNMLLGYRKGGSNNADYMIATYNGKSSKWGNLHQVFSGKGDYSDPFKGTSKTRNAYLNGLTYDKYGKLHVSWTWREVKEGVGNRDIGYAYSPDNGDTWYNTKDQVVANLDTSKLISTNSPSIVIKELNRGWGMMNSQSQTIDYNGVVHIVMYHRMEAGAETGWARINKDASYFHYYRKPDGTWQEIKLSLMGNRPKLIVDKHNNLYLIYMRKDHFESQDQAAPLVVARATAANNWTDWKEFFVSKEGYFNEPQIDLVRWQQKGVLSVMLQKAPLSSGAPSALSVLDITW